MCIFLNLNVNQGVLTAKSFQNIFCKIMLRDVESSRLKKKIFGEKFVSEGILDPLNRNSEWEGGGWFKSMELFSSRNNTFVFASLHCHAKIKNKNHNHSIN